MTKSSLPNAEDVCWSRCWSGAALLAVPEAQQIGRAGRPRGRHGAFPLSITDLGTYQSDRSDIGYQPGGYGGDLGRFMGLQTDVSRQCHSRDLEAMHRSASSHASQTRSQTVGS
jgi:hypothetical protein